MGADTYRATEVQGLSHCIDIGATGYLCLTKNRSWNTAFYALYIKTIAVEFIRKYRKIIIDKTQDFYLTDDEDDV